MIGSNKQLANQKPQQWTDTHHTHQSPLTEDDEIILNDGEMICDACDGTGWDKELTIWGGKNLCHKCQGEKKLDWISKITGVPEKEYTGVDNSGSIYFGTLSYTPSTFSIGKDTLIDDKPIGTCVKDVVAKKLAEEFDKQITEAITKHMEQNNKKEEEIF